MHQVKGSDKTMTEDEHKKLMKECIKDAKEITPNRYGGAEADIAVAIIAKELFHKRSK